MILRTLELKQFGKFPQRSFDFKRGMNLVLGPNEAGKSTIMEAVPAVLFGLRNKERFQPWGRKGSCEAALVLEGEGGTVRIEREMLSDRISLSEKDDLYNRLNSFEGKASPQGRSSERTEYLEQLTRLFGLAEDDLFRASLFFGQGSLELSGQGGLAGKIKTLLSGFSEVDYDGVLESLSEDLFAVTRENPWGKDKTKDRELEEVRRRIGELETRWFQGQEGIKELESLRRQIALLNQSLENDRSELVKGEKYLAWVRTQWQLDDKEETLRKNFNRVNRQSEKVGELEKQRQALQQQLAKTGLPREIPPDLPLLLTEAEEVRKEMVGLSGEGARLREQLLKCLTPPWVLSAVLSLLTIGAGAGIGWWFPSLRLPNLLGAGVLLAVFWGVYLRRAWVNRAERSRLTGLTQALERQREETQVRLADLDGRFESIGMSPSAVEIVRMQKNIEVHGRISRQLSEVESALKVLEKAEELTRDKDDLTRELAVVDERREKERALLNGAHLTPEELPGAEEKLHALAEDIRGREQQLLELTRREAALQGGMVDLQQMEDEGERLRERERRLVQRKSALCVAYDILSTAVRDFRTTYLERFSEEIGRYLATVTCGRYDQILLDDDFNLFLQGRKGEWQPVEYFSRGTADAVYLAVRLALTRHLSRGRKLPLLMDDPLVNFDAARLTETLKALENLSREHQVILFAHDGGLLRRAAQKRWNVISLEQMDEAAPAGGDERREDAEEGQLYLL